MVGVYISPKILEKLRVKHSLDQNDVIECFANREYSYLRDTRIKHQTDPETLWFIAPNNKGKLIKVVFMLLPPPDGRVVIKSAFEPIAIEKTIFFNNAKKIL